MKNEIAMLKAQIAEQRKMIEDLTSKVRKPSDLKIVVTENIPSKSAGKPAWGTVEITDTATGVVTKCFLDKRHDAGKRTDGADQTVYYATRMAEAAAKAAPAPTPAASEEEALPKF